MIDVASTRAAITFMEPPQPGAPHRLLAGGKSYVITLPHSLHFTHHSDAYSFEGRAYDLEYVVSQTSQ